MTNTQVVQNWTLLEVRSKFGDKRDVVYKVVKSGTRLFQEIREIDRTLIQTLELPPSAPLERSCFEVLLRHAMVDVAEAGMA